MAKLPKTVTRAIVAVVVLAVVAGGVYFVFFRGSSDKTVTAEFSSAVGVYPGTPVKILGVNVGTVSEVTPNGEFVKVKMTYDGQYKLPANADAVEVANSLVSDRYIQLTPVFTKRDQAMKSGGLIPLNRTESPAELDDIYAALNTLSVALGPKGANKGGKNGGALSTLIDVAAANLKGNGAALGNSITKLSEAAQTLAGSRGDLFATVQHLQKFTKALSQSDSQVRLFNTQLAQVAGDLAAERTDLGAALHQLGLALDDVNSFVKNNAGKFHTSIEGLKTITNILVKEKSSVNEALAVAPVALANIVHAYQPNIGVIATRSNLASLTDLKPTTVCAIIYETLQSQPSLLTLLGTLAKTVDDACTTLLSGGNPADLLKNLGKLFPGLDLTKLGDTVAGLLGGGGSNRLGQIIVTGNA